MAEERPIQIGLPGVPAPQAEVFQDPDGGTNGAKSVQPEHGHENAENSPFDDDFEFLDDIHGTIHLNRVETDVVDSPEFQRLFRLGQLGFVDLVYPTANHTRATHSIGADRKSVV